MKWFAQREAFYKIAVAQGVRAAGDLGEAFPLGYSVPEAKIAKWLRGLGKTENEFSGTRRYINRFKLGADPEFVVMRRELGERTRIDAATGLGLKQGLAFGADNNGRLVEVRPYPSRSALEVVASILETLRWMASYTATPYEWVCGAFIMDDGIGGHVHFGRKRPSRRAEIVALDALENTLTRAAVYPASEVDRRRRGDAHRQLYGMPGDFRLQAHGYEYRTFPSWLDSPEVAFLTLTLSKLAVQNPEFMNWRPSANQLQATFRLRNLLAYYKDADDDARLAHAMVARMNSLPSHRGGDFRPRWGIPTLAVTRTNIRVIPQAIKAHADTVKQVFDRFLLGENLDWVEPKVTWSPSTLPEGYSMCIERTETMQQKGLGELVWDLCSSSDTPIAFFSGRNLIPEGDKNPVLVFVSKDLYSTLPKEWRATKQVWHYNCPKWTIGLSQAALTTRARETRKLLLDGVLPIWRAKDVVAGSFKEWQDRKTVVKSVARDFRGEVVWRSPETPKPNNWPGIEGA